MKIFHLVSTLLGLACMQLAAQSLIAKEPAPKKAESTASIYKSIIRIEVTTQTADYATPWNAGRFGGGTGTGFLIGKNRFLTNAHVISNHRRIVVTMHGSPRKHRAHVVFVAHDCDLAIIEVEDFTPFEKLKPLEFDGVPKLESQVRVIGYPVGGNRISVTRGVVSRIDFRQYAHSRIDAHLIVQIDAAINPGNSGGPVLQNGKVVGVAFQGLSSADNTGYMIPTPVIKRFLKDISDGHYDQYVSLGISEFPLFNPAMRKVYGLRADDPGVLVTRVLSDAPCDGALQEGDIITSIDGLPVDSSGSISVAGERINMNEIVERKFAGDKVKIGYIRNGKAATVTVTLKPFPAAQIHAIQYGKRPRYTIQGGLVFQPLTLNLYSALRINNARVRSLFSKYITDGIYKKRKDIVILSRILNDPINSELNNFTGNAIASINGVAVTSLEQAHQLLNPKELPEFFVIKCEGVTRPLILPGKKLPEANQRIQRTYGIRSLSNLTQ